MSKSTELERSTAKLRFKMGINVPFLAAVIILVCMGIVMVSSASYVYAGHHHGDNLYFLIRHIVYALVGIGAMLLASDLSEEALKSMAIPLTIVSVILLGVVLLFSGDANGAKRWINLGFVTFQPSEIAKFAVILLTARIIDKNYDNMKLTAGTRASFVRIVLPFLLLIGIGAALIVLGFGNSFVFPKIFDCLEEVLPSGEPNGAYPFINFVKTNSVILGVLGIISLICSFIFASAVDLVGKAPAFYYGILPFGIIIVVIGGLLALEPHMSGLIIVTVIILMMMIVGGCPMRYIFGFSAVGGFGVFQLLKMFSHSSNRLAVWKNPFDYLKEGGWQPAQSLYAIGSGGLWGVGFGQSRQKHLYLPEPMNDYIFAILCEEFGFIGAVITILLFIYLVYRGIRIAFNAPSLFSALVVMGIMIQVGLQAPLNMMVVTNSIPSTGISLPFFSYGGTSLIILLAEMGVVLSVSRYSVVDKNNTMKEVRVR